MSSELVIRATQEGSQIALLENKQLVEFHEERYADQFNVGDIYLGKVRRIVKGLNAAFVDIGHAKDAFLHYLDLGVQFPSFCAYKDHVHKEGYTSLAAFERKEGLQKEGKIDEVLGRDTCLLVQIEKMPIAQKGPRISCQLSLVGRYLILVPFGEGVSVSRRIAQTKERTRLLRLVQSMCPANFGIIVRTASEGVSAAELHKDLTSRTDAWEGGMQQLHGAKPQQRIIGEARRSMLMLRDMLSDDLEALYTNKETLYEEVKAYVRDISPQKEKVVRLYEGKASIFEHFGVHKQLRSSFGRRVRLPGGGSLVIDQTEALHVIDVNSGKNIKEEDQESNALQVNLNAVPEISRQIRLRNLGGIIVTDFIDMRDRAHKAEIYNAMKEAMAKDRSKSTVLPLTKFGLMQMTRHRVRPSIRIDNSEKCPSCSGTGKVTNLLGLADLIEQHIEYLFKQQYLRALSIRVHPYLYAYFTKGLLSKKFHWWWKYRRTISLKKDSSLSITTFKFQDHKGTNIDLE